MKTRKTLYACRKLLNGEEFLEHFYKQGFPRAVTKTFSASDLHVTIAHSKKPFDWSSIKPHKQNVLIKGSSNNRSIKELGDKDAIVQTFSSSILHARWEALKALGAHWDYPTYQPHVTITFKHVDLDVSKIEPYLDNLLFGPEIFSEVSSDWEKDRE